MSGIGVGEVMSWLDLANKIKKLIQECNDRSKHLAEFTKCDSSEGSRNGQDLHACILARH